MNIKIPCEFEVKVELHTVDGEDRTQPRKGGWKPSPEEVAGQVLGPLQDSISGVSVDWKSDFVETDKTDGRGRSLAYSYEVQGVKSAGGGPVELKHVAPTVAVTEPASPAAGWIAEGGALGAEGRRIRAEALAIAAKVAAHLAEVPDSDRARAETAELEKQLAGLLKNVTVTVTPRLSDQELDWDAMGIDEVDQVTAQLVDEGLDMIRERSGQLSTGERFGLLEQIRPLFSPKLCACGCGQEVVSDNPRAEYATGACRVRALRAARK